MKPSKSYAISFAFSICSILALALLPGCASAPVEESAFTVHGEGPSDEGEQACAWFGDTRGRVLFFGEAAFWSEMRRAGGDPTGDLERPSAQRIGRFDLAAERMLAPLSVRMPGALTGVWDVLHHPNGRLYFSTFFETAGFVDPATGSSARIPGSEGWNELALGPDEELLVTRYAGPDGAGGSWLRADRHGRSLQETPLPAPERGRLTAKSIAFDPAREEVWVNADWVDGDSAAEGDAAEPPARHPTWIFGLSGELRATIEAPEIQFAHFDSEGRGALAEVDDAGLWLREIAPDTPSADWRDAPRLSLDADFPTDLDFVQELRTGDDGSWLVTRWSGAVHRVMPRAPEGDDPQRVRTLQLPRLDADGLYYTAVLREGRVCATYCAGRQVVCAPAP